MPEYRNFLSGGITFILRRILSIILFIAMTSYLSFGGWEEEEVTARGHSIKINREFVYCSFLLF